MKIHGVHWEERIRLNNGGDSYVVPFPTSRPVNLVYHGEQLFNYGHYGIHLGQEDRLTFLGPSNRTICARFIDCRAGSPTRGVREVVEFAPSSARTLCIPPGVAHAFDRLEGVHTVNDYRLFLPDPTAWLAGRTDWNPEADVLNVSLDTPEGAEPEFVPNVNKAADLFYALVAERQREALANGLSEDSEFDYPFTEDVQFRDGTSARLSFRKRREQGQHEPERKEIVFKIDGCRWESMSWLSSGPHSGFVPLFEARPFYLVDHGENSYAHDAYGIHLGQEDHLMFLGSSTHVIRLDLVDCRQGSATLHCKETISFSPSPHWRLVIPPGVAHRFSNLERVFTLNKPKIYLEPGVEYEPGSDVVDWSVRRSDYPTLAVNAVPAEHDYYLRQASDQADALARTDGHNASTPMVFLANDEQGQTVRVALRKIMND